ncbi:hypothetical protein BcepF1.081 [Burkholderia phage BcepF1]|uniref:Uncharacterized protein n=1 Tax=Burkholderia phage BcepF1 TaxID=2886897 RepID=A1YZY5_9CAUD|nr:hypothetical protein BcepF1.081 [Burkholderia phage BcepF1]ABL96812.1 hypothetical protein BcepF1.081 [Burkholderia phage BcepF1]
MRIQLINLGMIRNEIVAFEEVDNRGRRLGARIRVDFFDTKEV